MRHSRSSRLWPRSPCARRCSPTASAQVAGRPWTTPRTPDGHPDLQGFWTNDTVTPLERPAEFGDKEILTPEEAAAYAKKRRDQFLAQPKDNIHYDDAIWQDENYAKDVSTAHVARDRSARREAAAGDGGRANSAKRREPQSRQGTGVSDSAQTRSLAERCITWGNVGPPMIPPTYYANFQILQTRDAVVIRHETDARRAHHPARRPSRIRRRPSSISRVTRADAGRATRSSSIPPTSPTRRTSAGRRRPRARTSVARARCTSSSASRAWTRTPSAISSRSRIRRRGQGRGRARCRFDRSRARFTSTPATKGTTGWRTSFAHSGCEDAKAARPRSKGSSQLGPPEGGPDRVPRID